MQLSNFELLFKFKTSSSNRQCILRDTSESSVGQVFLAVRDGGLLTLSETYSSWAVINSSFRVDDNEWHYALAKRTTSTSELYHSLDGKTFSLIGSVSHSGSPTSSTVRIGNESGPNPFLGQLDLNESYIKLNDKVWFDGTEKLNEVVDLSGCINKGGLTSAELQTVINKGYTLVLN